MVIYLFISFCIVVLVLYNFDVSFCELCAVL